VDAKDYTIVQWIWNIKLIGGDKNDGLVDVSMMIKDIALLSPFKWSK
jgi:hypothetical protein